MGNLSTTRTHLQSIVTLCCALALACVDAIVTYDASASGLTSVPQDIWPNVTFVRLNGNSIAALAPGDLSDLPELTTVYLNNNNIATVAQTSLVNVPKLQTISATHNQITCVCHFKMAGDRVRTLQLGYNSLGGVAAGDLDGFSKLRNLHLEGATLGAYPNLSHVGPTLYGLRLDGAGLAAAPAALLALTPGLAYLHLADNLLAAFPDVRGLLPGLKTLDLSGNPLVCTEAMVWLSHVSFTYIGPPCVGNTTAVPTSDDGPTTEVSTPLNPQTTVDEVSTASFSESVACMNLSPQEMTAADRSDAGSPLLLSCIRRCSRRAACLAARLLHAQCRLLLAPPQPGPATAAGGGWWARACDQHVMQHSRKTNKFYRVA